MPELPEVETVARQLRPLLKGYVIHEAKYLDHKLGCCPLELAGSCITDVKREGKQLVLELLGDTNRFWLAVHLRMTGRLLYYNKRQSAGRYTRAAFALDRGTLHFDDTRRFGTLKLCYTEREFAAPGLDPTSPGCTRRRLAQMLAESTTAIKPWLLRQDRLCGIGNIYASESLFAAAIDPRRPACELSPTEVATLHRHLRRILRDAIRNCGTTFSDFQDAHGLTGSYRPMLKVYGRAGEPCPRCGDTLSAIVQHQRSTVWCPGCQS